MATELPLHLEVLFQRVENAFEEGASAHPSAGGDVREAIAQLRASMTEACSFESYKRSHEQISQWMERVGVAVGCRGTGAPVVVAVEKLADDHRAVHELVQRHLEVDGGDGTWHGSVHLETRAALKAFAAGRAPVNPARGQLTALQGKLFEIARCFSQGLTGATYQPGHEGYLSKAMDMLTEVLHPGTPEAHDYLEPGFQEKIAPTLKSTVMDGLATLARARLVDLCWVAEVLDLPRPDSSTKDFRDAVAEVALKLEALAEVDGILGLNSAVKPEARLEIARERLAVGASAWVEALLRFMESPNPGWSLPVSVTMGGAGRAPWVAQDTVGMDLETEATTRGEATVLLLAKMARKLLGDIAGLLAVAHRDGGHFQHTQGYAKALAAALEVIPGLLVDSDLLGSLSPALTPIAKFLHKERGGGGSFSDKATELLWVSDAGQRERSEPFITAEQICEFLALFPEDGSQPDVRSRATQYGDRKYAERGGCPTKFYDRCCRSAGHEDYCTPAPPLIHPIDLPLVPLRIVRRVLQDVSSLLAEVTRKQASLTGEAFAQALLSLALERLSPQDPGAAHADRDRG